MQMLPQIGLKKHSKAITQLSSFLKMPVKKRLKVSLLST
jgi:hypothetical protein